MSTHFIALSYPFIGKTKKQFTNDDLKIENVLNRVGSKGVVLPYRPLTPPYVPVWYTAVCQNIDN